ncbi:MAG: choice-of-anchor V domain-containing protein [Chitinophagales bacterium]
MTNSSSPPISRTGSPGDESVTCRSCHVGNPLNADNASISAIISQNGAAVTSYTPNETYDVEMAIIAVTDLGPSTRYGFEMTVEAADSTHHGTWIAGANTRIKGGESEYINHQSANNAISTWTFQWMAPSSDVGDLTFYVAGNMANGGGTSGDYIYTSNVSLTPAIVMPICDVSTILTSDAMPSSVTLSWDDTGADSYELAGRKQGGTTKFFPATTQTSRTFTSGLLPNTTYQWSVRSICNGETTAWAPVQSFMTN